MCSSSIANNGNLEVVPLNGDGASQPDKQKPTWFTAPPIPPFSSSVTESPLPVQRPFPEQVAGDESKSFPGIGSSAISAPSAVSPQKPVLSPKSEGLVQERDIPSFLDLPPPATLASTVDNNNEDDELASELGLPPGIGSLFRKRKPVDPNYWAKRTADMEKRSEPNPPHEPEPLFEHAFQRGSNERVPRLPSQPDSSERQRQLVDIWQHLVDELESETPHVFMGRSGGWHTLEEFMAGQKADLPWWKCCCTRVLCPRRILTLLLLFLLLACFWMLTRIALSVTGPDMHTGIDSPYIAVVRSIQPMPLPSQTPTTQ